MLSVSASLLNGWAYIWEAYNEEYALKAKEEFIDRIKGKPFEPTEAMQRGIDFEELAVAGQIPEISPIIAGGQHQVWATRIIEVDGIKVQLRGFLDTLKAGVIYDIKRTGQYEYPKYRTSYQHHIYFLLVPAAKRFEYLVGSGTTKEAYNKYVYFHREVYYNDGTSEQIIKNAIRGFWEWLKLHGVWEDYVKNFTR